MSEKLKTSPEPIAGAVKPEYPIADTRKHVKELAETNALSLELVTPERMNQRSIDELAAYFRFIFNNDWPEFGFCPPCDQRMPEGMRKSAKEIYGADSHVSLDTMDQSPQLPDCPCCGSKMRLFHDPAKTRLQMQRKLEKDGYISLQRSVNSQKIVGMTYGYGATLKEAFDLEWGNPHGYSAQPDHAYDRNFEKFLTALNSRITDTEFTPETQMFIWNCVAISKEARGRANFLNLTRNLFNALPPEKRDQRIVGECFPGSVAHSLFKTGGAIDLEGFLESGEIMVVFRVGELTDRLNLSVEDFYALRDRIANLDRTR